MSAEQALLDAYQEWCRLAKAGARAIRTGNRELLKECQSRIQQFQPVITRLTCEAREEWRQSNADFMAKEKHLSAMVSRLMDFTRENMNLIRQHRESARVRLQECAAAGQNLKRLQTYARAQQPRRIFFS